MTVLHTPHSQKKSCGGQIAPPHLPELISAVCSRSVDTVSCKYCVCKHMSLFNTVQRGEQTVAPCCNWTRGQETRGWQMFAQSVQVTPAPRFHFHFYFILSKEWFDTDAAFVSVKQGAAASARLTQPSVTHGNSCLVITVVARQQAETWESDITN